MRQVALAVIDLALIAGLVASIWFVVHNSRQRTRRIAEQLDCPITPTADQLLIRANRKERVAAAALFVVLIYLSIGWTVKGDVGVGIFMLLLSVACLVPTGRDALLRGPVLVVDGQGMTVTSFKGWRITRLERRIRWDALENVWIRERSGIYGITRHELVCESGSSQTRESGLDHSPLMVPLERLSMPWNDVAVAIQARLGRRVALIKR